MKKKILIVGGAIIVLVLAGLVLASLIPTDDWDFKGFYDILNVRKLTTQNITANYYCNATNCYTMSDLTAAGAGGVYYAGGVYIYLNGSDYFILNETKLNATIELLDDDTYVNSQCSAGDFIKNITGDTIYCDTPAGGGDITGVYGDGIYIYNGSASGSPTLVLNETKLNATIDDRDSDTTYTSGEGITITGTEVNHTDTSSQASSDNSGNTFIQDLVLDTFGHITSIVTAAVDFSSYVAIADLVGMVGNWSADQGDYYNKTEVDANLSNYIPSSDEGDLNVNSSDFWDGLNNTSDLNDAITLSEANITDEDWIEDSQEGDLNVNSSDYFDNMGSINATQMEDSGGVLNILVSWLTGLFYTETEVDTALAAQDECSEITNCVDDAYDSVAVIPNATPSDGDTTHLSTADQIYDWVIGLSYLVAGDIVGLVGNWSADKADYWDATTDLDNVIATDEITELKIDFNTACAAGNHLYVSGNNLACESDDDTTYTGGDAITLDGTEFDFDGGASPGGELGNSWASPTLDHDALDDQYYDSEGDLTGLLDDDYEPISAAHFDATTLNVTCLNSACTFFMNATDGCQYFPSGGQICSGV